MLNELLLLSGESIPYISAQISVHQPRIREISLIGEDVFFTGCELLRFSKNNLTEQDKARLVNQTDFDIIMSIMKDTKNLESRKSVTSALSVLSLMFPEHEIHIHSDHIALIKSLEINDNNQNGSEIAIINNSNYADFKEILVSMFCLSEQAEKEYNPKGDLASRIADKIKRGKQKVAEQKGSATERRVSVLGRYTSILSVGEQKDMNLLLNYTVFQLYDEFQRFQLKENHDLYVRAKLAGAKDMKEQESWMKDLYEKKTPNKK